MAAASRISLARTLARCRLARPRQLVVPGSVYSPATMSEALNVQELLHAELAGSGHHVVGHKIGCTTPIMQEYLGVPHPCAGAIYDTGLWRAETSGGASAASPMRIDTWARYRRLGLECEIAVVIGPEGLAAGEAAEAAARRVESVHVALELVDDRFENFEACKPGPTVWAADDFFHCGSCLGPAMEDVCPQHIDSLMGSMFVDGVCVGQGSGADIVQGHPLRALTWLAGSEVVDRMGGVIPPGWIVSLGSVTKTHWLGEKSKDGDSQADIRLVFGEASGGGDADSTKLKHELHLAIS